MWRYVATIVPFFQLNCAPLPYLQDVHGHTALLVACQNGHYQVNYLHQLGIFLVHIHNENKYTQNFIISRMGA